MSTPLVIILGTIVVASCVGLYAGRRQKMNLENWTVGGRRFGALLIWILMAGEIYTTFTFLGASGWAYSKGAPTYYILIYGALAYVLSFFFLPELWKVGKRNNLHTQADFFVHTYRSRFLGGLVALVGIASILPYLQLQLAGLGIVVEVASHQSISSKLAIVVAFVLTCGFVFTSGIRGSAWVSIIKDVLMILVITVVGIGIPHIYFGGFRQMFQDLIARVPGHLVFPGATSSMNTPWVMSTVLLTSAGFYMWPHVFGSAFSAKSDKIIKRNAIIMPLYQIPLVLVVMVGLSALIVIPGLKNGDLSFLVLIQKTYPAWFLGLVGAAGAVTAMVPASILVIFAATLLAKNIYHDIFRPGASDKTVMRLSRIMVMIIMAAALLFSLYFPRALVNLLLIGYDGVAQFFPGVILGLFWKRVRIEGVIAGLLAGLAAAAFLVFGRHDPLFGINAGFLALLLNGIIAVGISLAVGKMKMEKGARTSA